jgi:hypothetical protein
VRVPEELKIGNRNVFEAMHTLFNSLR